MANILRFEADEEYSYVVEDYGGDLDEIIDDYDFNDGYSSSDESVERVWKRQ
jgi:hypothetical protein